MADDANVVECLHCMLLLHCSCARDPATALNYIKPKTIQFCFCESKSRALRTTTPLDTRMRQRGAVRPARILTCGVSVLLQACLCSFKSAAAVDRCGRLLGDTLAARRAGILHMHCEAFLRELRSPACNHRHLKQHSLCRNVIDQRKSRWENS
jgi:hypothetical protein